MKKILTVAIASLLLTSCGNPTSATTDKSPYIGMTLPFSGFEKTKYVVGGSSNHFEVEMFDWCESSEIDIPDMLTHIKPSEQNPKSSATYSFALTTTPVYVTDDSGKKIIEDTYAVRIIGINSGNVSSASFESGFDTAFAAKHTGNSWTYAGVVYPTYDKSGEFYYSINFPYIRKASE